jgi:Secretion system C-terminal sorting domain
MNLIKLSFLRSFLFIAFLGVLAGCGKKEKQEIVNSSDIRLNTYPNPVSIRVFISVKYNRPQPGVLKVFSSEGSKIEEINIEANAGFKNYAIELENKPVGIYHVILETGNEFIRNTFLKTN